MKSTSLLRLVSVAALVLPVAVACSSSKATTKKPAAGAPKAPTTKPPATTPKPTASSGGKKGGTGVTGSKEQSAPTDVTCDASEEGLAVCVDQYVVFCASQKVYALDCAVAFGASATCGEIDGTIDCVELVQE